MVVACLCLCVLTVRVVCCVFKHVCGFDVSCLFLCLFDVYVCYCCLFCEVVIALLLVMCIVCLCVVFVL